METDMDGYVSGLKRRLSKIPDTLLEDGFHRILAKVLNNTSNCAVWSS